MSAPGRTPAAARRVDHTGDHVAHVSLLPPVPASGPAPGVHIVLHERGLRRTTQLADASFGTIRLLGLLALLYDPSPPALETAATSSGVEGPPPIGASTTGIVMSNRSLNAPRFTVSPLL